MIDVVRTVAELDALAHDWRQLERADPEATTFDSFAWSRAFVDAHPALDGALRVLVARRHGRVAAILPLVADEAGGTTTLRFLSAPWADDHDVIAAGTRGEAWALLVPALRSLAAAGAALELDELPARTAVQLTSLFGGDVTRAEASRSPYVELALHRRSERLRNKRNRLARRGAVELLVHTNEAAIAARLPDMRRAFAERWGDHPESAFFFEPRATAFVDALVRRLSPEGRIALGELTLDGEPLAFALLLVEERQVGFYQGAFSARHADVSPGLLLLESLFDHFRRRGAARFDLLRGEYAYKLRMAHGVRQAWRVSLPAGLARSALAG